MIITDTLSNFFSKIKNGLLAKKYKITHVKTNQIIKILNIFIKEGLIRGYTICKKNKQIINIFLKYKNIYNLNNDKVINQIIRISKPSKRVYIKNKDLYKKKKRGMYILSTSIGIITDLDAKKLNLGGELICNIY